MLSYKRLFACWWSTSLCFSSYVGGKKGISCLATVFHGFPYSWNIPLRSSQCFLNSKPLLKCWCHHYWEECKTKKASICRRLLKKTLLNIRTTNAVCWNHLCLFREYGLDQIFLWIFFISFQDRKLKLSASVWKRICETSQNFNSFSSFRQFLFPFFLSPVQRNKVFRITQPFKGFLRTKVKSFLLNSVSLDESLVWPHFNNKHFSIITFLIKTGMPVYLFHKKWHSARLFMHFPSIKVSYSDVWNY